MRTFLHYIGLKLITPLLAFSQQQPTIPPAPQHTIASDTRLRLLFLCPTLHSTPCNFDQYVACQSNQCVSNAASAQSVKAANDCQPCCYHTLLQFVGPHPLIRAVAMAVHGWFWFWGWEIWWVGKNVIPLRRNFVVIVMTPLSQCKGIL